MFDEEALERMTDSELLAALDELPETEHPQILEIQRSRAFDAGLFSEAASLAFRIGEIAKSIGNQRILARALADEGSALYRNDEYIEAAKKFDESAENYKAVGNQRRAADALYQKAEALLQLDNEESAVVAASEASDFAMMEGEYALVGKSMFIRGRALFYLSREEEAIPDLLNAVENLAIAGLSTLVAEVHEFTGRCLYALDRNEESISYLQKSLIILETIPSELAKRQLPELRQKIALNLYNLGRHDEAIEILEKAKQEFKDLEDIGWVATCEFDIGDSLQELDRDDEAIQYFLRAETLAESVGNRKLASRALSYRALSHQKERRYEEALDLNRRLIFSEKDRDNADSRELAYGGFTRSLANLIGLERFDEVISNFESPLSWPQFTPNSRDYLASKSFYCRALFAVDKRDAALRVANEGIEESSAEHWNNIIATFFEVRGLLTHESNAKQSEQDIANAIALYLAVGNNQKAKELSELFMPEFPDTKNLKNMSGEAFQ